MIQLQVGLAEASTKVTETNDRSGLQSVIYKKSPYQLEKKLLTLPEKNCLPYREKTPYYVWKKLLTGLRKKCLTFAARKETFDKINFLTQSSERTIARELWVCSHYLSSKKKKRMCLHIR